MPTLPYDLTNFTNITGMDDFMLAMNQSSGTLYFSSIPVIIFIVVLVGGLRFGTKTALLMASFITVALAQILNVTGGVHPSIFYGSMVVFVFALMVNVWVKD